MIFGESGRAALVLVVALAAGCGSRDRAAADRDMRDMPDMSSAPSMAALSGPRAKIADDLPLLPPGLEAAARPPEVVKLAYEFAARHPEVLTYVPCFCGCERMGHRGNEDCFVARRDAAGRVTEWEQHGMVCEICVDVATQAMQMHNAGASVATIRETIEARYGGTAPSHTPTPAPPPDRGGHY